jgi:hypothetical protein
MAFGVRASVLICLVALAASAVSLPAQQQDGGPGRGRGGEVRRTPKAMAPIDLTGYWAAVVTQDWRFRMVTPPKGDYAGVPLNAAARKVADAWDPAKDEAAGEACRSYGAAHIMRVPGRVNITWRNDQALQIAFDAGQQTRVLWFGTPETRGGDWQGLSTASWDTILVRRGALAGLVPGQQAATGSLKVVTTNLRAGYLRKNGVPYSTNTVLTEYFDRVNEPNGDSYLIVTTTVEDPTYLAQPYLYSTHFKKQPDGTGWAPAPCSAR